VARTLLSALLRAGLVGAGVVGRRFFVYGADTPVRAFALCGSVIFDVGTGVLARPSALNSRRSGGQLDTAQSHAGTFELASAYQSNMKTRCLILFLSLLATVAIAADKPTSIQDARAAVEANVSTPQGKAYDETLGKEFLEKHLGTMWQCKQSAGGDFASFWILMKLDKDGAVKEVLLHPTTKLGSFARETLLKSKFSPPPHPDYWGSVYFKISH
jgi:hypothetical protein